MRAAGATASCAESCTGGLVAGALTSVPGSSDVFQRSWVTYADPAKETELGVPAALLRAHGAVSGPVVEAIVAAILLAQRSLAEHVAAVARGLRQSTEAGRAAVAMIVSDPPSRIFLAAPKNRFGLCKAFASTPPDRIFPE